LIERNCARFGDIAADLGDESIPLVVGCRREASTPLPLVLDLREQPRGDGVLILGGKLLDL
jgi:hypothetical protein